MQIFTCSLMSAQSWQYETLRTKTEIGVCWKITVQIQL